ncbi:tetrapyrrole-binding protein, chloroplastic [Prosopis cineraria]|uniref:tetrapyrrole-binding protein, chloroplastic n=1 Tax=Prosopis cineraria TaxID=364024 RepID=UPI002410736B|nr:tetrapyrrole-binding protein, chloroplastic [Prosopis cineraria]
MASTNSLPSIRHPHHHHSLPNRRHPSSVLSFPLFPKSIAFNPNASLSSSSSPSSSLAFSVSPFTSSSTSPSQTVSFDLLRHHLAASDFRQADEETRRLIIVLAGDAAQKRGYVFFSEVQFISETDLKTIDELWRQYSDNKFGYSVQKRIFEKTERDFTKFFLKLGWMKKLDTEVEQYNYRSFPTEFMWELNDDTPEGHLPLTNALRGTQLLGSILSHPAFRAEEQDIVEDTASDNGLAGGVKDKEAVSKPFTKRIFKPDYSF